MADAGGPVFRAAQLKQKIRAVPGHRFGQLARETGGAVASDIA